MAAYSVPRPEFRRLHKVIIGAGNGVAVVLICRTMKIVGAGLGYQRHLRPGGAPGISVGVGGRDPELLHRIEGHGQDGGEGIAVHLVVHIHAVEGHVGLVAARAVHRAAAGIHIAVDIRAVSSVGDTRLQAKQVGNVPAFQRKVLYLALVESVT